MKEETAERSAVRIRVVPHTHWDREWFLPAEYAIEWLVPFFDELFRLLAAEPSFRFVLDGQTIMIEDYLAELARRGRDTASARSALARFASDGRLAIGPYYLQPDWRLASGEALIRNLLIGLKDAAAYGPPMPVGWLLDNFGQIGQAPQIHSQFGMKGLFFWRGLDLPPDRVATGLLWASPDGSALPTVYLLDSYRNAMRLLARPAFLESRIAAAVERIAPFSPTGTVLLMNGYDQETEPENLVPALANLAEKGTDIEITTPERYLREAFRGGGPDAVPRISGPQENGRYAAIFPGVLSSRMHLKIANRLCADLMERYVEPLAAAARVSGLRAVPSETAETGSAEQASPAAELEPIWREILRNLPHDDICGVSVDPIHRAMERRYARIERGLTARLCRYMSAFAARMRAAGACGVFNPLPRPRTDIVRVLRPFPGAIPVRSDGSPLPFQPELPQRRQGLTPSAGGHGDALFVLMHDLPPAGIASLSFREAGPGAGPSDAAPDGGERLRVNEAARSVENRWYRLTIGSDGSLALHDKTTGRRYAQLLVFEDRGDAGDTYSYSRPASDRIVTSAGTRAEIAFLSRGPLRCDVRITHALELPASLSEDRKSRSERTRTVPIVTILTANAVSPVVSFSTTIRNTVADHRLRVLFRTGLSGAAVSCAETQFDVTERPIETEPYDDGDIPPSLSRILIGAREPQPVVTHPFTRFVDISDGTGGFAVFANGPPEYEVIPDGRTTALTLLRSVGWLARGDLLDRTGDAGPLIYTPDARMLRDLEVRYALCAHAGTWEDARLGSLAEAWALRPLVACMPPESAAAAPASAARAEPHGSAGPAGGAKPADLPFLELASPGDVVRLSALAVNDAGDRLILRCWNPSRRNTAARIGFPSGLRGAWRADPAGREIEPLDIDPDGRRLHLPIGPKKIVTLLLAPEIPPEPSAAASARARAGGGPLLADQDPSYDPEPFFARFPSVAAVTRDDVDAEEARYEILRAELEKAEAARAPWKPGPAAGEVSTLRRTMLEARLSALLARRALGRRERGEERKEGEPRTEEPLRELGWELNRARIAKRTDDYLAESGNGKFQDGGSE